MKDVRVYTQTTVKGPGRKTGIYGYVLETDTKGGPATLTGFEQLENVTANQAEITAVTEALSHLTQRCRIEIYTESTYIVTAYTEGWIDNWKLAGWKNSKGKDIANKEEWMVLLEFIQKNQCSFITGGNHKYKEWLHAECRRRL